MLNRESILVSFFEKAADKSAPIEQLAKQCLEVLEPEWLTEKEVATRLRCSQSSVRNLWNKGKLKGRVTNPGSQKPRVIYHRNSLLLFESATVKTASSRR